MFYNHRKADEILTHVLLDSLHDWRITYWKLRRRGSFDFPVLSVAAAARFGGSGVVEVALIVICPAASRPRLASKAVRSRVRDGLPCQTISEAASPAVSIA